MLYLDTKEWFNVKYANTTDINVNYTLKPGNYLFSFGARLKLSYSLNMTTIFLEKLPLLEIENRSDDILNNTSSSSELNQLRVQQNFSLIVLIVFICVYRRKFHRFKNFFDHICTITCFEVNLHTLMKKGVLSTPLFITVAMYGLVFALISYDLNL